MDDCGLNTEIVIAAQSDAVSWALRDLRGRLDRMGAGAERCEIAELVLAEVLNNVVEHAMADRPEGVIRLSLCADSADLVCEVRDNGLAMPGGTLPRGALTAIGPRPETLPEGGFGWHLIHRLTRDLSYRRDGGWNHLRFRLPRSPAERSFRAG